MGTLRIATYNIHRCVGTDGAFRPDRVREVLRTIDASVIALQEVESGAAHANLPEYLAQAGPWTVVEGVTLERPGSRYGNALLTSLPIVGQERLDLAVEGREPRGALDLELRHAGGCLRVIATHLGLRPAERRAQARKLLDWIGLPAPDRDTTTVLMGDMNEWFLWGRPLRWLRGHFGPTPAPATFPSRWPLLALDRIWAHPGHRLLRTETLDTPLARHASDHRPLVGTLQLES